MQLQNKIVRMELLKVDSFRKFTIFLNIYSGFTNSFTSVPTLCKILANKTGNLSQIFLLALPVLEIRGYQARSHVFQNSRWQRYSELRDLCCQ